MARPEITARIGADGSGFRRELGSLQGFAKSWAGSIRSYFLSAFSITAVTQLIRKTLESVRTIDKLSAKLKISAGDVQQLQRYAALTGQEFDDIAKSADDIARALDESARAGIKPLYSDEDLQAVRDADKTIKEATDAAKVGAAESIGFWKNLWDSVATDWRTQQMDNERRFKEYQKWLDSFGPGEEKQEPAPAKDEMSAFQRFWRTVDPKQYFERYGLPGEQYDVDKKFKEDFEASWVDAYNKLAEEASRIHEGWPGIPKKKKEKTFEAPSDALASIGGFVGQGTQNRVQYHLQQMQKHLSNIDRTLVSRGIKIQDL